MASLTGNQVGASYLGIIKTLDNTAITASPKQLSDGAGNALTVCASSSSLIFTGTADFSAATVTGITTTDTTYDLGSAQNASNVNLNLTGSDATVDTITLVAGSNVTLTDNGSNNVTIDVAADTDTTYDLGSVQSGADVDVNLTGSDATTDTVKFAAGTNITLTDNGSCQITIDSASAAGLVNGTGADSLKNADSLVTNPATASGTCSIALGNGATAFANNSIVIGLNSCDVDASRVDAVYIGCNAHGAQCSIGIGKCAKTFSSNSVSIGSEASVSANGSVGIGQGAKVCGLGTCGISIGNVSEANGVNSISIGTTSCARANCSIAIGFNTQVFDSIRVDAIAIGNSARVAQCSIAIGSGTDAVDVAQVALGWCAQAGPSGGNIAIGCRAFANATAAVALGKGVTATRANYITGCAYEACVAGQGLVVTSPDGLTTLGIGIDNSGNIITYTP